MIDQLLTQYLKVYDSMKNHKWKELDKGSHNQTREYRDKFLEQAKKEIETMELPELVNALFVIYGLDRRCETMGFSHKNGIEIMRLKTKVMDRTLKLFNKSDAQTQSEVREKLKEISIFMPESELTS